MFANWPTCDSRFRIWSRLFFSFKLAPRCPGTNGTEVEGDLAESIAPSLGYANEGSLCLRASWRTQGKTNKIVIFSWESLQGLYLGLTRDTWKRDGLEYETVNIGIWICNISHGSASMCYRIVDRTDTSCSHNNKWRIIGSVLYTSEHQNLRHPEICTEYSSGIWNDRHFYIHHSSKKKNRYLNNIILLISIFRYIILQMKFVWKNPRSRAVLSPSSTSAWICRFSLSLKNPRERRRFSAPARVRESAGEVKGGETESARQKHRSPRYARIKEARHAESERKGGVREAYRQPFPPWPLAMATTLFASEHRSNGWAKSKRRLVTPAVTKSRSQEVACPRARPQGGGGGGLSFSWLSVPSRGPQGYRLLPVFLHPPPRGPDGRPGHLVVSQAQ